MGVTVSVLLPAYNVAAYIDEAVASLQLQTFSDFELIVIDDGSADGTRERLRAAARRDPRIRLIEHSRNQGLVASLNEGLEQARGEFVARMDADDVCAPQRLQLQLRAMSERPTLTVLGAQGWFIGARRGLCRRPVGTQACRRRLPFDNPLLHNVVMMRSRWLRERGIQYRPQALYAEDYDLWVQVAEFGGELDNLPQALVGYRIHDASTTQSHAAVQERTAQSIRARLWARAGVFFDVQTHEWLAARPFQPGWWLTDDERLRLRHVVRELKHGGFDHAEIGRFVLSVLPRARSAAQRGTLAFAAAQVAPMEVAAFAARYARGQR